LPKPELTIKQTTTTIPTQAMRRIIQSCKCNPITVKAQFNVTLKAGPPIQHDKVLTTSLFQQMIMLQQNMLKTLRVSLSVKTNPSMLYIVHSQQNTTMQYFHLKKTKNTVTKNSTIMSSHRFNTILLRFRHTVINYAVQNSIYTIKQS
jgi:hypothetical protein